jgi:hypothetical protein
MDAGGPAAVEQAVYRGRDEVSDGLPRLGRPGSDSTWRSTRFATWGTRSCGWGAARMRGSDVSHVEFDQEFAVHFLVRDGKIIRIQGSLTWQEALEAAGLSE